MGLAAACDICVATEEAVFAISEVRFGIIRSAISPYVIRAIGERQAARYFQSGERLSAAKAELLGLAHEVVPAAGIDTKISEIVEALLLGGPQAQAAAKRLITAVGKRSVPDSVIEDTAQRIARLRVTPEAKEGLSSFLEKPPAAWHVLD